MVGQLHQIRGYGSRIVCDDEQRLFLVFLIKRVDHLRVAELVDDGVQCDIHAEDGSGNEDDNSTEQQHIVEGGYLIFGGEGHGDEIRSASAGPVVQDEAHAQAVDDSAEYGDEKKVSGDGDDRQLIRSRGSHRTES